MFIHQISCVEVSIFIWKRYNHLITFPKMENGFFPPTQAVRIFGEIFQCRLLPRFHGAQMGKHELPTGYLQQRKTLNLFSPQLGLKTPWHIFVGYLFSQTDSMTPGWQPSEFRINYPRGKNLKGHSFSGPFPNHPDVSTTFPMGGKKKWSLHESFWEIHLSQIRIIPNGASF